jgi:hypothetical protein
LARTKRREEESFLARRTLPVRTKRREEEELFWREPKKRRTRRIIFGENTNQEQEQQHGHRSPFLQICFTKNSNIFTPGVSKKLVSVPGSNKCTFYK